MTEPGRKTPTFAELPIDQLLDVARGMVPHAYVPYSGFPVGAAVLTDDGTIVAGVNVENASYGLTCCGERNAVFTAVGQGHRTIRAVAISTPRSPGATPCGACRQVLNEFKPEDAPMAVILDGSEGAIVTDLDRLLPHAFGPRDLG
ncbi:MAG: cytidine deaminase [Thermomicrobiales bacterium]